MACIFSVFLIHSKQYQIFVEAFDSFHLDYQALIFLSIIESQQKMDDVQLKKANYSSVLFKLTILKIMQVLYINVSFLILLIFL